MEIIRAIRKKDPIAISSARTLEEIKKAEEKLGLSFASDYKKYLSQFGFVIFVAHELTGLCNSKRLNVVDVTIDERSVSSSIPNDWYVVEQIGIDGVVIWQSPDGKIYQSKYGMSPSLICDSLTDYILSF